MKKSLHTKDPRSSKPARRSDDARRPAGKTTKYKGKSQFSDRDKAFVPVEDRKFAPRSAGKAGKVTHRNFRDRDDGGAQSRPASRSEGRASPHSRAEGRAYPGAQTDDRVNSRAGGRSRPSSGRPSKRPASGKRADSRAGERSYNTERAYASNRPFASERPQARPAGGKRVSSRPMGGAARSAPARAATRDVARASQPIVKGNNVLLWGLHAVRAAWLNPERSCHRLWLSEAGQAAFADTLTAAKGDLLKRPDAKICDRSELDRLTPPGSVHQGIVLEVVPLPEPTLQSVIGGDNPPDLIIMLDQVTDPHNVGAILRSASAFGAGAVIMTERNAPSMTGVLAKSASGAVEHTPQIHVVNLARALDDLQEAGYWRIGLAEEGAQDLAAHDLSGRTVLVLGAEGEGLRQLTRKKCDELARLPTGGAIGSLNVSNAAAVALYEVRRQKQGYPNRKA